MQPRLNAHGGRSQRRQAIAIMPAQGQVRLRGLGALRSPVVAAPLFEGVLVQGDSSRTGWGCLFFQGELSDRLSRQQLPQHVVQNAAVAVIRHFIQRVDAAVQGHGLLAAVGPVNP